MRDFLGEFEQMVLLAILQAGEDAYAIAVRSHLEESTGRKVSRGALYRTLDRLDEKGFVSWEADEGVPDRGGHPRRRFRVTREGIASLKLSRAALLQLWRGLDKVLGKP
jgi:PadR family transcriptional regulator